MFDPTILRSFSFLCREAAQLAEAVDYLGRNAAAGAEEPYLEMVGRALVSQLDALMDACQAMRRNCEQIAAGNAASPFAFAQDETPPVEAASS